MSRSNKVQEGAAAAAALLLLLCLAGGFFYQLAAPAATQVEIAGFATTLRGRTASQRYNARRAAEALDGITIAPGAVFSFNRTVRSWSLDEGYVKAPVSYDGELVKAYGGGVCQTSTTLYNAALLAGLPIVERHAHVFAPHYVPPGRDAAVAQYNIDLRFRNPYPWPLTIRASARGDRLDIRLLGRQRPAMRVEVTSDILSTQAPLRLTRVLHRRDGTTGRAYIRNPGATGYRVVTCRIFSKDGKEVRRERLADDTYEAMNRIVQMTEPETPQTFAGE
ncbi:MAG TPA: VanW family protein [Chthonomonadaceae bacterium]|nr:VanW family protein [Chthonomonadaceae bacterium]